MSHPHGHSHIDETGLRVTDVTPPAGHTGAPHPRVIHPPLIAKVAQPRHFRPHHLRPHCTRKRRA